MGHNPFEGRWKLYSSENYEDYMKELGAPGFVITMVASMRPKIDVRVDDDHYRFKMIFPSLDIVDEFTIDEEFEGETMDGSKKIGIVRQPNKYKLVEQTREGKVDVKTIREVDDDELTITWKVGDVVAVRVFRRE